MRLQSVVTSRSRRARLLATTMVAVMVGTVGPARSNPGDIFQLGAPVIGSGPPKGEDIKVGDTSVSATGAFQYSYPIAVPPGRNGMQPSLALTYSSQAPIYGGIAAGWTLSGPHVISRDTSKGIIFGTRSYTSTLAGGRPLVQVTEPWESEGVRLVFRAQNDSTFTRYERLETSGPRWRAQSPDGTTYYFGDPDHHTCGQMVSHDYAPLTRVEDKFGNAIEYYYGSSFPGECRIEYITWGQNAGAGIPGYFAAAVFEYRDAREGSMCVGIPVGSAASWRTGTRIVSGASRLSSVTLAAFRPGTGSPPSQVIPTLRDHTRVIKLGYSKDSEQCDRTHAAYRSLVEISETAWGTDSPQVTLPSITFNYGSADFGNAPLVWPSVPDVRGLPWYSPIGSSGFNLGWGYRPSNGAPTVEAMMIDVDGDGLLDRLWNASPPGSRTGSVTRCTARWERNPGRFETFEDKGEIELPTLKWASPGSYDGGKQSRPGEESCALNYQRTQYTNSFNSGTSGFNCPGFQACPTSGPHPGRCDNGNDCTGKLGNSGPTTLSYRWFDIDGDMLPDLVASPTEASFKSYNLQQGAYPDSPIEPAIFARTPWIDETDNDPTNDCPKPSFTAYPNDASKQYTMCNGMFPWFIYKNHGNGVFGIPQGKGENPLPDKIMYQPIPLESSSGDSSITSEPVGQYQGTIDVDGDGFIDAVNLQNNTWKVFGNDGTGQLRPYFGASPYNFTAPYSSAISRTTWPVNTSNPLNVEGILDLNGDGLVDHWFGDGEAVKANENIGTQFNSSVFVLNHRPGTQAVTGFPSPCPGSGCSVGTTPVNGWRTEVRRPFDMDLDGRTDIMVRPAPGYGFSTHYNQGGQYTEAVGAAFAEPGQGHRIVVSEGIPGPVTSRSWEVRSDFIDIDGDGIPESVDFERGIPSTEKMVISKIETPTEPPRLLVGIDNGRGASTSISYSPLREPVVKQVPSEPQQAMPQTQWVVASHSTTDHLDNPQTTSTTSYYYVAPKFLQDNEGRYGFRGFEQIATTLPSGAVREDTYDFDVDPTGRLARSVMRASSADGNLDARTVDITKWEPFELFGGRITTYHPVLKEHLVCRNGRYECTPEDAAGYSRTTSKMEAISSSTIGGDPLMWKETASVVQAGRQDADGDRLYETKYFLKADSKGFRLVTLEETRNYRVGPEYKLFGLRTMEWTNPIAGDDSYRVLYSDTVWNDDQAANASTTFRTYDLKTGNVKFEWKPLQWAKNPNQNTNLIRTSFDYDSRQLFVEREVNELAHVVDYTYEYGTGTKVMTRGPNVAECASSGSCPSGEPQVEEDWIRVDGIGRVIERYETFSEDGFEYRRRKVETNTYVDGPNPSITHESAIEFDEHAQAVRYTRDKTELDGHGRPTRTIVYVFGTAPADQITTFRYNDDGTLAAVTVPDPTANDTSTVTYTYAWDSLGRATNIRRPDAPILADRSGIDIDYDGLTKKQVEYVRAGNGERASTVTTTDIFGRLVEVQEKAVSSPLSWAVTKYEYDSNDNVHRIIDAEGAVTTLDHDFTSRRTAITRAGKTWFYGYDLNGNMISERTPCAPAGGCEANHTTSISYDELDRVRSKLLAPRALSSADRALFGSDVEEFTYDTGANSIGRLVGWESFGPSAAPATLSYDFRYNLQGQLRASHEIVRAAGYNGLERSFERSYNLAGNVVSTFYGDVVGTQNCQSGSYSEHHYDARGLPFSVYINSCPNLAASYSSIINQRNVAGLVTKRYSQAGNGPFTYVESAWTYDKLGRVGSQTVRKGAALEQVVKQQLTYFGNDNPSTLTHWLGATNQKRFLFTYDARHQLKNVAEEVLPNAFTAAYDYGVAGRFKSANVAAAPLPNSDVKPRNVTYQYSPADPEQVIALKAGATTYASYAYDSAGNQTARDYPNGAHANNEHWDYVYDGKNQLRRVTKKVNGVVQGGEEYWYDANNSRTLIVTRNASGAKTGARWFIGDTEAEYDATGNVTRAFGHVSIGTPVARFDRSSDAAASVEYQFHGLASNTIAVVAQDSGAINATFTYAPFGEIIEATNAGGVSSGVPSHRRRMNDKFIDDISKLAYYGYRYYDAISMMWTQSDPLYRFAPESASTEPRKAALYVTSLSNPLRYVDPDGRQVAPAEIMRWGLDTMNQMGQSGGAPGRTAGTVLFVGTVVVAGLVYVHNSDTMRGAANATRAALGALVAPLPIRPLLMGDRDRITPPSWVKQGGLYPLATETAQEFATRVLDDKYGKGNYPKKGGGNEYNQIVKWVNRVVRAGGAAVVVRSKNDSNDEDPSQQERNKPADADGNGEVSDDEMSNWSKAENDKAGR